MFFDAKFFTLLTFIIINFLILFIIKTRTTSITSLIIAHLVAVLFFSLSISNYNSFKEIVLALIVYSMVILFLISNYNPIYLTGDKSNKAKHSWLLWLTIPLISSIVLSIFFAVFFITKNIPQLAKTIHEKEFSRQNEIAKNPMILPSHAVHMAVKTFYLGKKFKDDWSDKSYVEIEMNEKKRARLKDKLSDNFLLKRSSDVILIIVAVSTSLLLLNGKKIEKNS
jgi:hypothetical protein